MPARDLDSYDLAILRLLQSDAGLPQREIAERVNLSAPAVQRRIARLQEDRVIEGMVAVLSPQAVGFPITAIVEVTLENDRSTSVAAAKAFFKEAPEVQQCYIVAGVAGFIVILAVPSMEDYERHSTRLFSDNDLVRSFRTIFVLDRVKTGQCFPI